VGRKLVSSDHCHPNFAAVIFFLNFLAPIRIRIFLIEIFKSSLKKDQTFVLQLYSLTLYLCATVELND
jgi:hypothetical protein